MNFSLRIFKLLLSLWSKSCSINRQLIQQPIFQLLPNQAISSRYFLHTPTTYYQNLSEIDQKSITDESTSSTNNASANSGAVYVYLREW